jgi:hypothetical protein
MQRTSVPAAHYDRVATQRLFNELALDLTRHDAQLEQYSKGTYTVGDGWSEWFNAASHNLSDARDAFSQIAPQEVELRAQLGDKVISLASQGGRLGAWHEDGRTFARSWGSALDSTIATVQEAVNRLYGTGPTPPVTPPVPPVTPPHPGSGEVIRDAAQAAKLVRRSLETIRQLPTDDTGTAGTKDARIAAYNLNMDAQKLIEPYFNGTDEFVTSQLRSADASLEDANWQLAKKPSPDGRFNGVDVPGAQRDTDAAATTLEKLVSALSSGA